MCNPWELPCFPCNADKTPMTTRGYLDAKPGFLGGALVGVPTGETTGFDVLDIDLKAKEWWIANRWRMPTTKTHRTRSGGLHLFFAHEPGLRNTTSRIALGVDTRGDGGYIIWWPAIGCPVLSHLSPAPWPPWLLEAQRRPEPTREVTEFTPPTDAYARAALRSAAGIVAQAPEGTRNHTLNAQTFALSRFIPQGLLTTVEIAVPMLQAAIASGLSPLEAQRTIASALRR